MFSVGDKVVYPMHGAGQIEAVEERVYEAQPTKYLVLSMFLGNMKVRIPVCNLEKVTHTCMQSGKGRAAPNHSQKQDERNTESFGNRSGQ